MLTSYKHKIYVPEIGWLTSYKRKIYVGRSIEWNQLSDKSKYSATKTISGVTFTNNGDGTITVGGTATANAIFSPISLSNPIAIIPGHKFFFVSCPTGGAMGTYYSDLKTIPEDNVFNDVGAGVFLTTALTTTGLCYNVRIMSGYNCNNLVFKPQLFDLTQMFGAGNEPTTPVEFWSYFDHRLYPYSAGETQPLMRISRKSKIAGELPQLASPQDVFVSGKMASWNPVEHATVYKIRLGNILIGTTSQSPVDITVLPKYSSVSLGVHKLTIVAYAPGYMDSNPSQEVDFINGYPITFSVTNCTYSPDVAMVSAFESTTFTFTKSIGYSLPSSITVTGASSEEYSWNVASNGRTAILVITEPASAVNITVVAVVESYAVTVNGTNASKKSGPTTVQYGGAGTFTFEYPSGYFAPDNVTVSGAILDSWDKTTSELVIRDVSGPVIIKIVGVPKTYVVNYNLTNCATYSGNPTDISSGDSGVQLRINKVNYYDLPQNMSDITVANATLDSWTLSVDGTYGIAIISDPTGDVTITVNGVSVYDYTFDKTTGILTLNRAPYSQSGDELTIL